MKIINVTPGLLPIPPNGWGAVEKIIWETHNCLLELGHESKICYLDEVDGTEDIVHIHVANLANLAHERGIKYAFTLHDHHAYLYGKESHVYFENLQAIQNAEVAFVPAKFLLEYFGNPENLFYFSHGVNVDAFKKSSFEGEHRLLCVANNGFIHDQSEDRKGFMYAIEAAKKLNLQITIVGPENNRKFFDRFPQDYDKLTIKFNLTEDELIEEYSKHTIFVHPSILEAGHPNLTLLEAIASGLPVVATFEENNFLSGLIRIDRDVDSVIKGILHAIDNYDKYRLFCETSSNKLTWKNRVKELLVYYKNHYNMKNELIYAYENTQPLNLLPRKTHPTFNYNFVSGAFFEILGNASTVYKVEFIDRLNGNIVYSTEMNGNCWAKCNREYFTDWLIRVDDGEDQYEYYLDLRERRVLINFDSSSLGDSFAWIPIVRQFKEKYGCEVIVSTFHNSLFKDAYPELTFISPGEGVDNLFASYSLGYWYDNAGYNMSKHPVNPFTRPLQAAASDILGVEFTEERPRLHISSDLLPEIDGDYICIAPHSTAHAKYWNFPGGWQKVIDYYNSLGYKVVYVSNEDPDSGWTHQNVGELTNIVKRNGLPLERVLADIKGAKAFIGLGSGLSWAAWACGTPVTLISGFSDTISEFSDCERLINKSVCNGCWNRTLFDKGDWEWCPDHKGTPRHFECSKAISPHDVIFATNRNLAK